MTTMIGQHLMCFKLRPLPDGPGRERWQWTVYSYPHLVFLRDGQIVGDREMAERTARLAIMAMGGRVGGLCQARAR